MHRTAQVSHILTILMLIFFLSIVWGCSPMAVAFREVTYHPSPGDPYRIWKSYVTDSGLLFLCGSVDNGQEGVKRVNRVYNLELRLEDTLAPLRSDAIQTVKIDEHTSLQMTKGYSSDLCQFDKKRSEKMPNETGWTDIFMVPGRKGYVKIYRSDVKAGSLPIPPENVRIVLYPVRESEPPEYLLMGRLRKDGPMQRVLLILGNEHIKALW